MAENTVAHLRRSRSIGALLGLAAAPALAACGGGDGGAAAVDAGQPDARPSCDIEVAVGELAAAGSVDCGTVAFDGKHDAAHDCAASAFTDGVSFHVVWESPGTDSIIRGGYVGVGNGATVEVQRLWYDSDPSGGSNIGAVLSTAPCSEFSAIASCTNPYADLCFSCSPP